MRLGVPCAVLCVEENAYELVQRSPLGRANQQGGTSRPPHPSLTYKDPEIQSG